MLTFLDPFWTSIGVKSWETLVEGKNQAACTLARLSPMLLLHSWTLESIASIAPALTTIGPALAALAPNLIALTLLCPLYHLYQLYLCNPCTLINVVLSCPHHLQVESPSYLHSQNSKWYSYVPTTGPTFLDKKAKTNHWGDVSEPPIYITYHIQKHLSSVH